MQSVSIIGISSGVGKHLVHALSRSSEDYALKGLTRNLTQSSSSVPVIRMYQGDLLKRATLEEFIAEGDVVINLAYLVQGSFEENLQAIKNLVAVCRQKKIKRLIHYSTVAVYGAPRSNDIQDNDSCYPTSQYGKTKLAMDRFLLEEGRPYFEVVILRPAVIFGKGCENLIKDMMTHLQAKSKLNNYLKDCLSANRNMHLVCVENVVAATQRLLQENKLNENIFIVSDDDDALNQYLDVVTYVSQALGIRRRVPVLPLPLIIYKTMYKLIGHGEINPRAKYRTKNLQEIGFSKVMSVSEGLANYMSEFK